MKSRISFFDKTVIRKDITRFLPLWLVYFIGGTLVMLVSAFAGREQVLNAYEQAVQERYRFFSFGDAMFIG